MYDGLKREGGLLHHKTVQRVPDVKKLFGESSRPLLSPGDQDSVPKALRRHENPHQIVGNSLRGQSEQKHDPSRKDDKGNKIQPDHAGSPFPSLRNTASSSCGTPYWIRRRFRLSDMMFGLSKYPSTMNSPFSTVFFVIL